MGKAHRYIIPKSSTSKSTRLLELAHSDLNGPPEVPLLGGSRYSVTFVDDFSKRTVLYTMKAKSETLDCFKRYHLLAERHRGQQVATLNVVKRTLKDKAKTKILRKDNGGEYVSNPFKGQSRVSWYPTLIHGRLYSTTGRRGGPYEPHIDVLYSIDVAWS